MQRFEHGADHLGVFSVVRRVEVHHGSKLVTPPPAQAHIAQCLHRQPCQADTTGRMREYTNDIWTRQMMMMMMHREAQSDSGAQESTETSAAALAGACC